jgi:ubiquitin-conjugating enzyme E2 R
LEGVLFALEDENLFVWRVYLEGPSGTAYAGGVFQLQLRFPATYPMAPPTLRFLSDFWHPNVFANGHVCISILHTPTNDPTSGELAGERWMPTQTPQSIVLSVMSMLSDPNFSSPANVDASVQLRTDPDAYHRRCADLAQRATRLLPPGVVIPHPDSDPAQRARELRKLKRDANIVEPGDEWLENEWAADLDEGEPDLPSGEPSPPPPAAQPTEPIVVAPVVAPPPPTAAAAAADDADDADPDDVPVSPKKRKSRRSKSRRSAAALSRAPVEKVSEQDRCVSELLAALGGGASTAVLSPAPVDLPLLASVALPGPLPPLTTDAADFDWYSLTANPDAPLLAVRTVDDYLGVPDAPTPAVGAPPQSLAIHNAASACWQFDAGQWTRAAVDANATADVGELRIASCTLAVRDAASAGVALDALERVAGAADLLALHRCSAVFAQLLFRAAFVRAAFFVVCDFVSPAAGALPAVGGSSLSATVVLTRHCPALCAVTALPAVPFASADERTLHRRAVTLAFVIGGAGAAAPPSAAPAPLQKRASFLSRSLSSSRGRVPSDTAPAAGPDVFILTTALLSAHADAALEQVGEVLTASAASAGVLEALSHRAVQSSAASPAPLRKARLSERLSRRLSLSSSALNAAAEAEKSTPSGAAPAPPSASYELGLFDVGADAAPPVASSLKALAFASASPVGSVLAGVRSRAPESAPTSTWQQANESTQALSDSLVDALTRDATPSAGVRLHGGIDVGVFVRAALAKVDEKALKPTLNGAAFKWIKRGK